MIRMKVSEREAIKIFSGITHKTFQKGIGTRWNKKGIPQRICWLFCWGNRKLQSPATSKRAREAFDKIFSKSYIWLEGKITIEQAHIFRYID